MDGGIASLTQSLPAIQPRLIAEDVDALLRWAAAHDVSDVTVQPDAPVKAFRRGQQMLLTSRQLEQGEVAMWARCVYGGPTADVQLEAGNDFDCSFEIALSRQESIRWRVNGTAGRLAGRRKGYQLTMRLLPAVPPDLKDLNLEPPLLDALIPAQGLGLVGGATGSGKSTLLAAVVRNLVEEGRNEKILTYEAPIEFVYDRVPYAHSSNSVFQTEIGLHLSGEGGFAYGVRNMLRRAPTTGLIGEARDAETIGAALEAALTGHRVYTTTHATDVPAAIRRLLLVFPAAERDGRLVDLLESLRFIVVQRLVLPAVEGARRVALRSFLVFDREVREQLFRLAAHSPGDLPQAVRRMVLERGQSFGAAATAAFEAGLISANSCRAVLQTEGES